MLEFLTKVVKGFLVGLALVVPGLSAATFAVVTGIYETMIHSMNNIRKEFRSSMRFLLPIGLGAFVGVLASAGLTLYLLDTFPLQSYAVFIGLVLGSVPVIYGKMKPAIKVKKNYFLLLAGLAAILVITFVTTPDAHDATTIYVIDGIGDVLVIFLAGLVSCILMAFPGISGSIILMLMGMFTTVYGAVTRLPETAAIPILAIFVAGALVGLILAAKIMGFFIEKHEASVYFMVLGLVLGAVVTLVHMGITEPITYDTSGPAIALNILWLVVFIAAGYFFTRLISKNRAKT
ncbi:MAG: DUF368 domain-containing protein [Defluviitaleaceae bacterium]|nr:DUF368 domain-containing protein [Defluviitaleaceae bacterium]